MKHALFKCNAQCAGCFACDGGLAACTVCGGAESSLPTECPGAEMSANFQDAVSAGDMDFTGGEWVTLRRRTWTVVVPGRAAFQMILDEGPMSRTEVLKEVRVTWPSASVY